MGVGAVEVFEPGGPKMPHFSRGGDRAGAGPTALARIRGRHGANRSSKVGLLGARGNGHELQILSKGFLGWHKREFFFKHNE